MKSQGIDVIRFFPGIEERVKDFPLNRHSIGEDFALNVCEIANIACRILYYTREELADYFTLEEAVFIISAINGSMYGGRPKPKEALLEIMIGHYKFEWVEGDFKVDIDILLEKIDALSEFQAYAVIANGFLFHNNYSTGIVENFEEKVKNVFLIT